MSSDTYVSKNRAWLEPYVRDLIRIMKLEHWHITLEEGWPEEHGGDANACAWRSVDYNRARLYLHNDSYDLYDLRWHLVHELLHLLTRDWDNAVDDLEEHLNPAAWHVAQKRLKHEEEQMVEAIAYAWAESLPLPVKADEEEAA